MTIVEHALERIRPGMQVGLGSGRAAQAFVRGLAERIANEKFPIQGVPTSEETAALAGQLGIPLRTLADAGELDITVDGADEVDPQLNLIKGYGRALLREKIVAASSKQLLILVGEEKLVPRLGTRGKLPIEVLPFALPLCQRRLRELGCEPVPDLRNGELFLTDNENYILDCRVEPLDDPHGLDAAIREIPGVVGTGLFLQMADVVLVGDSQSFVLRRELRRSKTNGPTTC